MNVQSANDDSSIPKPTEAPLVISAPLKYWVPPTVKPLNTSVIDGGVPTNVRELDSGVMNS